MDEWYQYGNRSFATYKAQRYIQNWHTKLHQDPVWKQKRVVFVNNNLAIPYMRATQNAYLNVTSVDALWPGLFRRFFQPAPAVAHFMQSLVHNHSLQAGHYAAAHLRAKWPQALQGHRLSYVNQKKWWKADKQGGILNMTDKNTSALIALLGDHVVECAVRIMPETKHVYVCSDASEVIQYLKSNSTSWKDEKNGTTSPPRQWTGANPLYRKSKDANLHGWGVGPWTIPTQATILARPDYLQEAPHFDGQVWDSPQAGYGVIVDLWLLAHANCTSHGVGGFGRFGSVLSGNRATCTSRHRDYEYLSPSCATPQERKDWKAQHPNIKYKTRW